MQKKRSVALAAEFVGTFVLVFVGVGAGIVGGDLVGTALANGLVVTGLIYAYGRLSGTHINPAVTVGLWLARAIDARNAVGYVIVQVLGGLAASLALGRLLAEATWAESGLGVTRLTPGLTPVHGLAIESILTFVLVSVILHTAVDRQAGGHAGMAIGATLSALILMGGPLTGGGFNPARSLGPALVTGDIQNLWLYIVGPVAGATVAAGVYRLLRTSPV